MQKTDTDSRRDFLKKIPFALASISAFSLFRFKKSNHNSELKFNTLSKSEADEIIKNEEFPASTYLNPAAAPVAEKNLKG